MYLIGNELSTDNPVKEVDIFPRIKTLKRMFSPDTFISFPHYSKPLIFNDILNSTPNNILRRTKTTVYSDGVQHLIPIVLV